MLEKALNTISYLGAQQSTRRGSTARQKTVLHWSSNKTGTEHNDL